MRFIYLLESGVTGLLEPQTQYESLGRAQEAGMKAAQAYIAEHGGLPEGHVLEWFAQDMEKGFWYLTAYRPPRGQYEELTRYFYIMRYPTRLSDEA